MKRQVYAPLLVLMMVAAGGITIHSWFTTLFSSGPWFIIGFVLNVAAIFAFSLFLLGQFAIYVKATPTSRLRKISDYISFRFLWGEFDTFICILISIALCFFLYGRVAVGDCIRDDGSTIAAIVPSQYDLHWWWTEDINTRWPLLCCNPEAASRMLPQDSYMLLFLVPAGFQVCVKGASKWAAVISWIVGTICVIGCALKLENIEGNVWVIMYPSLFLLLAYEHERFKMASFLASRLALEATVSKVQNERKVISILLSRDQKAKEKEQKMLRSLIGNVAHDMKTPLLSIIMGLETLRTTILDDIGRLVAHRKELPPPAETVQLAPATEEVDDGSTTDIHPDRNEGEQQMSVTAVPPPSSIGGAVGAAEAGSPGSDDLLPLPATGATGASLRTGSTMMASTSTVPRPLLGLAPITGDLYLSTRYLTTAISTLTNAGETIAQMDASCSFMSMSINRAIDFTKASRNIALVPKIVSFDIIESLKSQMWKMNSLRASSSAPLVVLDLSSLVSPPKDRFQKVVMADKHWLEENVLCLLSNAVKFSQDNTTVNVSVILERTRSLSGNRVYGAGGGGREGSGMFDGVLSTLKTFHNQFITPVRRMRGDDDGGEDFLGSGPPIRPASLPAGAHKWWGQQQQEEEVALVKKEEKESVGAAKEEGGVEPNKGSPKRRSARAVATTLTAPLRPRETKDALAVGAPSPSPSRFILRPWAKRNHPDAKVPVWTDMLRITVEDTGPGLSEEAIEALFKPSKQAKRSTGGAGLGLYSLTKRTDALGGRCGVQAREDGKPGCVFWFTIPYLPDRTDDQEYLDEDKESLDAFAHRPASVAVLSALLEDRRRRASAAASRRILNKATTIRVGDGHSIARGSDVLLSSFAINRVVARTGGDHVETQPQPASGEQKGAENYAPPPGRSELGLNINEGGEAGNGRETRETSSYVNSVTILSRIPSRDPEGGMLKRPPPPLNSFPSVRGLSTAAVLGLRVLVVDDSLTILRMVSRSLEEKGFIVDTAKNGLIALEKMISADKAVAAAVEAEVEAEAVRKESKVDAASSIKLTSPSLEPLDLVPNSDRERKLSLEEAAAISMSQDYDVVLMDIQMPVMGGCEATKKYRTHEAKNDIMNCKKKKKRLIIGMSANSDSETKRLAKEAGMDHFLEKPFVVADFIKLLGPR